ncbi:MAG: hypothetical protein ABIH76_01920 [Candidatus Bathyarchaeota archaeon]
MSSSEIESEINSTFKGKCPLCHDKATFTVAKKSRFDSPRFYCSQCEAVWEYWADWEKKSRMRGARLLDAGKSAIGEEYQGKFLDTSTWLSFMEKKIVEPEKSTAPVEPTSEPKVKVQPIIKEMSSVGVRTRATKSGIYKAPISGSYSTGCPYCGNINSLKLSHSVNAVTCPNQYCSREWHLGEFKTALATVIRFEKNEARSGGTNWVVKLGSSEGEYMLKFWTLAPVELRPEDVVTISYTKNKGGLFTKRWSGDWDFKPKIIVNHTFDEGWRL